MIEAIAGAVVATSCVIGLFAKFNTARVYMEVYSLHLGSVVRAPLSPRPSHGNASTSDSNAEENKGSSNAHTKKEIKKDSCSGLEHGT